MATPTLTLEVLKQAVATNAAAIRRITQLEPAGGSADKVFPPTYEGGEYAEEQRKVRAADGTVETVKTVLLDSVQSQANRMEHALLHAYRANRLKFPLMAVDFTKTENGKDETDPIVRDIGKITALEAPHRAADAIFRDSVSAGQLFRESALGQKLTHARVQNATPMFELCPTALVFGMWDSTGPRGGAGAKFQRAVVSEIVGFDVEPGVRPSSRIDPLQIEREGVVVYQKAGGAGYTVDAAEARKDEKGNPMKLGDGKPSELNHGNITPSFRDKNGNLNPGGFTLHYAVQTTVLSLAALRRLNFPLADAKPPAQEKLNNAARTTLAALALASICCQEQDGYDLRSRCLLDGKPGTFELIAQGESKHFSLTAEEACKLLDSAATEAEKLGLPWPVAEKVLFPSIELRQLVLKSRNAKLTSEPQPAPAATQEIAKKGRSKAAKG